MLNPCQGQHFCLSKKQIPALIQPDSKKDDLLPSLQELSHSPDVLSIKSFRLSSHLKNSTASHLTQPSDCANLQAILSDLWQSFILNFGEIFTAPPCASKVPSQVQHKASTSILTISFLFFLCYGGCGLKKLEAHFVSTPVK